MVDALNYTKHFYVVLLGFHGLSTHFRSYRERSITLADTAWTAIQAQYRIQGKAFILSGGHTGLKIV